MVIELFVGPVAGQFAAWSPMFPGMVSFSHDPMRALSLAQEACANVLRYKRTKNPALPDPELIEWVTRNGPVPRSFAAAYQSALDVLQPAAHA